MDVKVKVKSIYSPRAAHDGSTLQCEVGILRKVKRVMGGWVRWWSGEVWGGGCADAV